MMEKPEVGVEACSVALGNLPAPWSRRSVTARADKPYVPTQLQHCDDRGFRPYNVGSWRNRKQLERAVGTQDAACQLRRLEQAMEGCRFDYGMKKQMDVATARAKELARRFEFEGVDDVTRPGTEASQLSKKSLPKAKASPSGVKSDVHETEEVEPDVETKQLVEDEDVELSKAALKIQAVQRGKAARKQVDELSKARQAEQDELIFYNEVDEACTMRLSGGDEGQVEIQDDLGGGGIGVFNGTYQITEGEGDLQNIVIALTGGGDRIETVLDMKRMTYVSPT